MADCTIAPITANKACSGKCKSGGCNSAPCIWVLAVCEGMAALFQKQTNGHLLPLLEDGTNISSFANGLSDRLSNASEHGDFSQLVLVGSGNDISWTQASLPNAVSKHVVAEIQYPLVAGWFAQTDWHKLAQALNHLFKV